MTDTDDIEACDTTSKHTDCHMDMLEQNDIMEATPTNTADYLVKLQLRLLWK